MPIRTCETCCYSTNNKWLYDAHMKSSRHLRTIQGMETGITMHICEYCSKKYESFSGLWRHKQKCHPSSSPKTIDVTHEDVQNIIARLNTIETHLVQPPPPQEHPLPLSTPPPTRQYVYIIQLREFIQSNTPVYKIGKTKQANTKRLAQYPKGSELVIQCDTPCCDQTEQAILQLFKEKYTHRPDIGAEYFEGDARAMKRDLYDLCEAP